MELVYLWIEDYKNIKNQGFNFSPRFDCKYDGKKLTIIDKEETGEFYPKNFFDDNINITAIIGENGSGKSSIINEIVNNIIYNEKIEYKKKAPLICYLNTDKKTIYIFSHLVNDKNIKSDFNFRITHFYENDNFPNSLSNEYETTKYGNVKVLSAFKKDYYNSFYYFYNNHLEIDTELYKVYDYNPELLIYSAINKTNDNINLVEYNNKTFDDLIILLQNQDRIPKNIKNIFYPTKLYLNRNILIKHFEYSENEIDEEKKYWEMRGNLEVNELIKLETILTMNYFIKRNSSNNTYDDIIGHIRLLFTRLEKIENYTDVYESIQPNLTEYLSKINYEKKDIRYDDNKSNDIKELNELEKYLSLLENLKVLSELIEKVNNNNLDYEINTNNLTYENIRFLKQLPSYLEIDFANNSGKRYEELSSGERNLLKLIFSIEDIIHLRTKKSNSLFILLDEIENTFHPAWQKKILNWLIEFLKHYKMQFNIIISSHSPFILSDIPKENIIFLKNGKQEYPFKDNEQTFGANIHTLLSHGFFMEEGLMGEFAKDKIQDVINFLNKGKSTIQNKEEAWNIIQVIGEPFLKYKLEEKYHENYSNEKVRNEAKIKRLKEEIERLENDNP